jgi:multiple sugar transport system substrate-binding protein
MNRYRSAGWVTVASALSLVTLAACTPGGGGGSTGEGGGGQMLWAIGGSEAKPGGVHQEIAKLWSEKNPDNPIRIEVLPDEADQQREQQALELQAEGSTFDVLGMDVIWTGEYSTNGWLESLEDVRAEVEDVSIPGAFESGTWNDELWAAPYNSNAGFLYYRTDLVDEPPKTWDELCKVASQVGQQEGIGGYIGQGARYEGYVVNWLEVYWSAGGELFNEDQSAAEFDTDLATDTTEWFIEGTESGCFARGFNTAMEEEARNEFQSGKAVFMRNWPYAYGLIKEDKESPIRNKSDVAPLPTQSGDGTISALGGFNNAVSAFSDNKEAAKEFVVWASTDEEVQRMLAESSLPPTMASVYEDFGDDPVMSLLGQVLPDAKPRPPAPTWNEISVEMQRNLFGAYNGENDPEEASRAVLEAIEGAVG